MCEKSGCRSRKKKIYLAFRRNCVLKNFLRTLDDDSDEGKSDLGEVAEESVMCSTERYNEAYSK